MNHDRGESVRKLRSLCKQDALAIARIFPIPFSRRSSAFEASDFREKAAKLFGRI